jgi:hypothetical protein
MRPIRTWRTLSDARRHRSHVGSTLTTPDLDDNGILVF